MVWRGTTRLAFAALMAWSLVGAGLRIGRAQGQEPDREGCKDSPLITRFPGSRLTDCENQEYQQFPMKIGQTKALEDIMQNLEGEYHKYAYETREGVTQIQIFRNIENALRTAGLTIVWNGSPGTLTARKGNTWYYIDIDPGSYRQVILTTKDMKQEVTADASSLAGELDKSGHVAVYGIHFDTAKADILPDSEQALGQIVQMLSSNGALRLLVEGYTDNVGTPAANQALSEKRAQAVMAWLIAHGVNGARLMAKGWGETNPVGDNSTEDGRAKNRRVELVKI